MSSVDASEQAMLNSHVVEQKLLYLKYAGVKDDNSSRVGLSWSFFVLFYFADKNALD